MSLSADTRLGPYEILSTLGAGGMGEVYRARDTRLEREVALKILGRNLLADDAARKRFRKEAQALAKLNHPHIAHVYDFASEGGVDFLVMELVSGEPLSRRIEGSPLPEKEVLAYGTQLAAGLAAAHGEGVIHCDLKPANLRLTRDGGLKILDFGLAKLRHPANPEEATASLLSTDLTVSGTLPYMAPEQLRAEPLDARTDLWGAGVVLYELTTGTRPFRETVPARLMDAILHAAPDPPTSRRKEISPGLERLILRCLEKDPALRFQTAGELKAELERLAVPATPAAAALRPAIPRWWLATAAAVLVALAALVVVVKPWRLSSKAPPAGAPIASLAVLPLANLSKDPEQQYFSDGMHDELIARLSKLRGVKVISRTSVLRYRDTVRPLPEIGRELGVDAIVEGSVRRAGDRVAITVQAIRAATDEHLWADTYERKLEDVLTLQSEIAEAVARAIGSALSSGAKGIAAAPKKVNPAAYDAYLRGRQALLTGSSGDVWQAKSWFEKAIALEPGFSLAYAYLGITYLRLGLWDQMRRHEAYVEAEKIEERAVELEDTPEARYMLAMIRGNTRNAWEEGRGAIEALLAADPNNAGAHRSYASVNSFDGRHDQAIAHARKAVEIEPFAAYDEILLGEFLYFARRYDDALRQCQNVTEQHPDIGRAWQCVALVNLVRNDQKKAVKAQETAARVEPRLKRMLAYVYAKASRMAEARRILGELEADWSAGRPTSPVTIGLIHLALGEREQVFPWLERGFDDYDPALFTLQDPVWDPIREDPRFQWAMRRRAGQVKGPYLPPTS
jgi:TolB-like protein